MKNYEVQVIRGLKRKIYFVEKLGGKCEKCGYDKNLSSLNFHHKNPNQKSFQLDMRNMTNRNFELLETEVKKCQLLCSNCHNELHNPDLEMIMVIEKLENYKEQKLKRNKKQKSFCECGKEIHTRSERCEKCNYESRRKVERPNKDELLLEVKRTSQQKVADKYGVSRTTIRRWLNLL